jgi:hypothetical protein
MSFFLWNWKKSLRRFNAILVCATPACLRLFPEGEIRTVIFYTSEPNAVHQVLAINTSNSIQFFNIRAYLIVSLI